MPRTVLVESFYDEDGSPSEYGRCTLDDKGCAVVSGFPASLRKQYETVGIKDRIGFGGRERGTMVTTKDGNAFLDLIKQEYSGSRVVARDL